MFSHLQYFKNIHCVKCPYSELFWSAFFPHSDWIRRNTKKYSVFSPNEGKRGENADQNNSDMNVFYAVFKFLILSHKEFQYFENYITFFEFSVFSSWLFLCFYINALYLPKNSSDFSFAQLRRHLLSCLCQREEL